MRQKIQENVKEALRARDEIKVGALRMLLAAFINKEKANNQESLTEEMMQEIVASEVKKRREAIEGFEKGGRIEMAEKEKKEMEILQQYLPEQLSKEEILQLVKEAIEKSGATSAQDIGKVMSELKSQIKGRADGSLVSGLVKDHLDNS